MIKLIVISFLRRFDFLIGKLFVKHSNTGHFMLDSNANGVALDVMCASGGSGVVIGRTTNQDLYKQINAIMMGVTMGKQLFKKKVEEF